MRINNGAGKPNYSQRNNKEDPDGSCNVSAAISAIVSAGWDLPICDGQPEDALHLFIESDPKCVDYYARIDPDKTIPPQQWHPILMLGVNRWIKRDIAKFVMDATVDQILSHILSGGTGYTSGMFPTTRGHFVAFVGFEADTKTGKPVPIKWIIKDPWGDMHTNYKVIVGDNIEITHEEFMRIIRPMNMETKLFTFIQPRK